jgi:hypothetical protein
MGSQTIEQLVESADPQVQQYIKMLQDKVGSLEAQLSGVMGELQYLNRALWGAKQDEDLHRAIDSDLGLIKGGTVDLPPVPDK